MFDPRLGSEKDTDEVKAWALPLRKLVLLLVSGDSDLFEGGHFPEDSGSLEENRQGEGTIAAVGEGDDRMIRRENLSLESSNLFWRPWPPSYNPE